MWQGQELKYRGDFTVLMVEPKTPAETESLRGSPNLIFGMCGEWQVPLTRDVVITREARNVYRAVLLGRELAFVLPDGVTDGELAEIDATIGGAATLRHAGAGARAAAPPGGWDAKATSNIDTAATLAKKGIGMGTGLAIKGIATGTRLFRSKTRSAEREAQVSPETMQRLEGAKHATGVAVNVSETLVSAVFGVTQQIAKGIAKSVGTPGGDSAAGRVAGTAVRAGVDVLETATDAVQEVVGAAGHGGAECVGHRYGGQAEAAAHVGADAATNAFHAGKNVQGLGAKGIAKGLAKETGKQMASNATVTTA